MVFAGAAALRSGHEESCSRNRLFALAILALPLLIAACNGTGAAPGY